MRHKVSTAAAACIMCSVWIGIAHSQIPPQAGPSIKQPELGGARLIDDHFIQGKAQFVGCPVAPHALKAEAREYFYVWSPGGLQIPISRELLGNPPGTLPPASIDKLMVGARELEQGKLLWQGTVNPNSSFRVGWREGLIASLAGHRLPVIENVTRIPARGQTQTTHVYRFIYLKFNFVNPPQPQYVVRTSPSVLLSYMANEGTKDVGTDKVTCIPRGTPILGESGLPELP